MNGRNATLITMGQVQAEHICNSSLYASAGHLFERLDTDVYDVKLSLYRICGENIQDLLRSKSSLQEVKRTAGTKDVLKSSMKVDIKSTEEAQRFILRAMKARNCIKGHVVLCYDVKRLADGAMTKLKILDLLMLVNGESTQPDQEINLINQEIASVERVQMALKRKQNLYIPYRDSQVIKLAQDTVTKDGLISVILHSTKNVYLFY